MMNYLLQVPDLACYSMFDTQYDVFGASANYCMWAIKFARSPSPAHPHTNHTIC